MEKTPLPTVSAETCGSEARCSWSPNAFKHFGKRGLTPRHTEKGPSKYLVSLKQPDIERIERETTAAGARRPSASHAEYLRDVGEVIGYDLGEDASLSFVECSGGEVDGRSFHGRPMAPKNPKARSFSEGET